MTPKENLEGFRDHVKNLQASGVPLGRALESGRKYFDHPLIDPFPPELIEIRNEFISEFGAQDVFREAYRQLRASIESPECTEVYMMVGPPGAGKSTLSKRLSNPGRVIFDSAAYTAKARSAVIGMARENGKSVSAVIVCPDLDTCLFQNSMRVGPKVVPADVIVRAHETVSSMPPTMLEGFDSVLHY